MTTTLTKQDEYTRYVTDDTLQSLNLKTDSNFYEYIILIVGIDDHHYLFENLPTIISKDRIQLFEDVEKSLKYIHSLYNVNIFLIISGKLGKDYAHQFIQEQQILGIYIYCMDESKHALWTKGLEKIRCIVSDTTQLFVRLHGDIKQLSGRWPLGEKSFQKALTSASQWYHLFLLVICYRSQHIENTYHEMFNECRAYYRNNHTRIEQINQLEGTYKASDAIREYTRDSFLYRIVNHGLRTQNMKIIRTFSPFIRDLHSQLHHYHREYYHFKEPSIRVVYRGQSLSLDELDYLSSICRSRRPVITLTTFTSASLDPEMALNFACPVNDRIPCLFEIIITDEYNFDHKHMPDHAQAFANILHFPSCHMNKKCSFLL